MIYNVVHVYLQVSPVLWYVPLVDSRGESLNGHTVFVDNTRCLIALDDGTGRLKPAMRGHSKCFLKCQVSPHHTHISMLKYKLVENCNLEISLSQVFPVHVLLYIYL